MLFLLLFFIPVSLFAAQANYQSTMTRTDSAVITTPMTPIAPAQTMEQAIVQIGTDELEQLAIRAIGMFCNNHPNAQSSSFRAQVISEIQNALHSPIQEMQEGINALRSNTPHPQAQSIIMNALHGLIQNQEQQLLNSIPKQESLCKVIMSGVGATIASAIIGISVHYSGTGC